MNRWICVFLLVMCLGSASQAQSNSKTFFMSCTYGVLAGTLVGAATLAFTNQPGSNLRNIAMGASLGLYSGILLGLYVIYLVPDESEYDQGPAPEELDPAVQEALSASTSRLLHKPIIHPILNDKSEVDGFGLQVRLMEF